MDMMRMISTKEYTVDEVLPYITKEDSSRVYEGYRVRMSSERYQVFAKSTRCVACGLKGTVFLLSQGWNDPADRAHFNLYGRTSEGLILFTKDHILPRSKGGKNRLDNYQTMCYPCNKRKGNNV